MYARWKNETKNMAKDEVEEDVDEVEEDVDEMEEDRDQVDEVEEVFDELARDFYLRYEPKEILGSGISSVVRRCIEKETGVEYAAKIIDMSADPDDPDGSYLREEITHEISILRLVSGHPFIVELHEVFETRTYIFIVLELCKKGELFDYLTTVVTLSEKKTRNVMFQLFDAVQFLHDKNIVHRDIKPENILLDDNLNIKLSDFGFARQLRDDERLTDLCGTPGYLAPELLKTTMHEDGKGYGKAVDLWACGVIMYTVLVGWPPFWHKKQMIMLRNIMEGKYSFNTPDWESITETPKNLISKLLVTDPEQRFSVQQVLQHDFFQIITLQVAPFNARKMFKFAILCVRVVIRIKRLKYTSEPLPVEIARIDPYMNKLLRKVIDACAFSVYGHWVKKGETQNRAALFENRPKTELRRLKNEEIKEEEISSS